MGSEITKDVLVSAVDRLVAALGAHTAAITDHMETMQSVDASLSGIEDGLNDLLGRGGTTNYLESHTRAVAELDDTLGYFPSELSKLALAYERQAKTTSALGNQLQGLEDVMIALKTAIEVEGVLR